MDASQYKDYILTLLFVKYVTDKFQGVKSVSYTHLERRESPRRPGGAEGCPRAGERSAESVSRPGEGSAQGEYGGV